MSDQVLPSAGPWVFLCTLKGAFESQGMPLPDEQTFIKDGLSAWATLTPAQRSQFCSNAEPAYNQYRLQHGLAPEQWFHEFTLPFIPPEICKPTLPPKASTTAPVTGKGHTSDYSQTTQAMGQAQYISGVGMGQFHLPLAQQRTYDAFGVYNGSIQSGISSNTTIYESGSMSVNVNGSTSREYIPGRIPVPYIDASVSQASAPFPPDDGKFSFDEWLS
ncbi:hypothetical protein NLI96_g7197 [Meripilus lineatus]|uniref:Uncharacterized protein n=1 Tax=Meripilus lineatus TaxID=2056292 RepID=A0AAD5YHG9_9APHY|nr:hypothetical protein NLI96_g7197 [Physisporinus lineatus]